MSAHTPDREASLESWLRYISTQHTQEIALGLERSKTVAAQMKLLPLSPRTMIVAGTNGKGSTVRFAESLLLAQGYSVGATLSPHMHRYNERVRINGAQASDRQLVDAFAAVDTGRRGVPLTYYEYSILAAFWLFREAGVEVSVLEVGLGGRLDVTNIVDAEVAVVTSIGLDHQSFLGDTLDKIGAEKAAVCRTGAPLLLGGAMPPAVTELAQSRGAKISHFGRDYWYQRSTTDWTLRFRNFPQRKCAPAQDSASTVLPKIAQRNAALAAAAVAELTRVPTSAELTQACTSCTHPGRFETVRFRDRTLVLDVAHNPASAGFLARQLRTRFPAQRGRRLIACVGFLADKDVTAIMQEVAGLFADWVFVPTTGPRGLSVDTALERALEGEVDKVADSQVADRHVADSGGALSSARISALANAQTSEDVAEGMTLAHARAGKADIIVAFGSFQHVQHVRELVFPDERGTA